MQSRRQDDLLANWIGHDLRFAFRILAKNPQSTVLSVLTLALGLGATSAAFTAAQAWLIRPFPFPEPERLVRVEGRHVMGGVGARYRDFLDWRARNQVFEEIAIIQWSKSTFADRDGAMGITNCVATAGTPRVMGTGPTRGRFFNEQEDAPGGPRVALVSEATWQRRFGGRPDVVGSVATINGNPHTIIGVMSDRAVLPGMPMAELWLPLREDPLGPRVGQQYYGLFARLKPGVTLQAARTQMDEIARTLEQEYPGSNQGWQIRLTSAEAFIRDKALVPVVALFSIALCLLLLVSANVGGILLARASGRMNEMAVRAALGASRWRIVRQFLTESMVLGILGGAGALLVAYWLLHAASALVPNRGFEVTLRLDGFVLLFTFGLSITTGLFFGLSSAFQGSRAQLGTALQASGSRSGGAWQRGRLLSGLVVIEIALSLVLLVGGGLLTRDVVRLLSADTGVKAEGVLTFSVELPRRYASSGQRAAFPSHLVERLLTLPGVESAAAIAALPMSGNKTAGRFTIGDDSAGAKEKSPLAIVNASTPGYFRTIGIPLLQGRDFTRADRIGAPAVVVTNKTLAERYFSGSQVIGQRIVLSDGEARTIVGVVGDVRHDGPQRRPSPEIYLPLAQDPAREMSFVVRSRTDPKALMTAVRDTIRGLDPLVTVERLRPMAAVIEDSLMQPRRLSLILSGFALFGLLLAAMGLYGLLSYSVARRTHEIGVRMAMGASAARIQRLVVRKGLVLAAAGLLVGMPLAFGFAQMLKNFLAFTSPQDVAVFTGIPMIVLAVALAATYLPARRATRVPLVVALRCE